MKFFKNLLINFAGQWVVIFLMFAVNVVVTRVAGAEGKGIYALLVMFGAFIVLLSNFGLSRAMIYFIGQGDCTLRSAVNNIWTLSWFIGILSAATGAVLLYFADFQLFEGLPKTYAIAMACAAPLLLGNLAISNTFIATEKFVLANLVPSVKAAMSLLLLLVLPWFGVERSLLIITIISSLFVSSLVGWYAVYRHTRELRFEIDLGLVKKFFSYGLRAYSYSLTSFLNLRLDQFLIAIFLNVTQVGFYSNAVAISELASKSSMALSTVLFPRISASNALDANRLTGFVSRSMVALTLILIVVLGLFGKRLLVLFFGAEFSQAYTALLLLLPGVLAFNLSQILSTDLSGRGKPEVGTYTTIIGIIITVIGNYLFTPTYGINGAAAVATVAYFCAALITLIIYSMESSQNIMEILFVSKSDFLVLGKLSKQLRSFV